MDKYDEGDFGIPDGFWEAALVVTGLVPFNLLGREIAASPIWRRPQEGEESDQEGRYLG